MNKFFDEIPVFADERGKFRELTALERAVLTQRATVDGVLDIERLKFLVAQAERVGL